MKLKRLHVLVLVLGLALCSIPFHARIRSGAISAFQILKGRRSVSERVAEFGGAVHSRLADRFKALGVAYPPPKIVFAVLKHEQLLEVWVADQNGRLKLLKTYPILAASGTLGPKLAEGDGQVPEGLYRIESLNPNSLYHLSLRLNYPNAFDKAQGALDGRAKLGSDIMIHGKEVSIGCVAVGDQAVEDLFVMVAESGRGSVSVIISPVDFRIRDLPPALPKLPPWTPVVYREIEAELKKLAK